MRGAFSRIVGLGCLAAGTVFGQTTAKAPDVSPPQETAIRTYYLNATSQQEQNEVVTALRNILDARDRVFVVPGNGALVVSAPLAQLQLTERLLRELDKPRKLFRLTYTLSAFDGGKPVGVQRYAMETAAGQRTAMRELSRVPAQTSEAQYTILDVGVTFDATLDESSGGLRLKSKVEDTSIAPDRAEGAPRYPVSRVITLEGTSVLALGKAVELGSLDVPGSTRHVKVEVSVELVK